jgi:hypothetical protein
MVFVFIKDLLSVVGEMSGSTRHMDVGSGPDNPDFGDWIYARSAEMTVDAAPAAR